MIHPTRAERFAPHPELSEAERQPCELWTHVEGGVRPVNSLCEAERGEYFARQFLRETGCCGKT